VGDTKPVNRERWMVIAAIAAMLLIPVFGWWFYNPEEGSGYAKFSLESIRSGWDQAHQVLETKIDTLKNKIINTASSSVGRLVFLWTVIGIILVQVLIILSIPYAILAGYAFKKDLIFPNAIAVKPWKLFVYCNVGILVLFTLTWLFLTDRYPLALVVTLLMTVPFALEQVYENWRSRADRAIMFKAGYILLGLILVFNVVEGFTSYSDKRYLKESGIWLRDNVHQSTRLYTNDHIIGFYSGLPEINTSVVQNRDKMLALFYRGKWIKYDYLALQVDPDPEFERHLKKTLWVVPEQVFRGNRNREVRVYNIKKYRERKNQ
jgi:hypothetical protein